MEKKKDRYMRQNEAKGVRKGRRRRRGTKGKKGEAIRKGKK